MLLVFGLTLLGAAPASSSVPVVMPGEAEAERFKELFERGEALYGQGEFGSAIYFFKQADSQRVTAEVAYDLAKSYEKVGDDAFALYYYRLYVKRAPEATDVLTVSDLVGKALSKAGADNQGFLELDAPRATSVTVNAAGQTALRYPEPPVALFLTPGEYEVAAIFPTGIKTMKVHLKKGQASTVSFEPVRPPMIPVENALPPELLLTKTAPTPLPMKPLRIGAWASFAVAAVAIVTGAALGAMSTGDDARLKTDRTLTVKQAQGLADSANGKALGANLLMFGVGGAAAAGGGLMFVFSMPEPGMKSSERP